MKIYSKDDLLKNFEETKFCKLNVGWKNTIQSFSQIRYIIFASVQILNLSSHWDTQYINVIIHHKLTFQIIYLD